MAPDTKAARAERLSPDTLIHLKSYKYSSVDKSYISYYILRHYWNACVEFLPLWLAPNMVTLLGFFFVIGNVALLVAKVPTMDGQEPSWVYFSFAFGVWMYSTLDNIDGKQARRTGTSSPLGELFDHGIDSLNCTLASLCEVAAMGLGTSFPGVFTALVPCLPMFFSTWETYHTHTLYLGVVNGPTEGLILACTAMIVGGLYGPAVFSQPLSMLGESYFQGVLAPLGKLTLIDIWVPIIAFSLVVAHVPFCVYNVIVARRARNQPIAPVFLEWFPMLVYTASIVLWLGSPTSALIADNHLVLFSVTMSVVFGRMTTKIILAHLTRQPFPMWTVMLWPLIGGAVLVNAPPLLGLEPVSPDVELAYLWGYLVFAYVAYGRWAYIVIGSICDYLGINCLTIPHAKQKELMNDVVVCEENPGGSFELDKETGCAFAFVTTLNDVDDNRENEKNNAGNPELRGFYKSLSHELRLSELLPGDQYSIDLVHFYHEYESKILHVDNLSHCI